MSRARRVRILPIWVARGPVKLFDAILDFDAALDWPLDDEDLDLAYEPTDPQALDTIPA